MPFLRNMAENWRRVATLSLCLTGALAVILALAVEWKVAPEWESPRKLFTIESIGWNPWHPFFFLEAVQVAVLFRIKRGRFLLGWSVAKFVLIVALTCFHWRNAVAYLFLAAITVVAGSVGLRIFRASGRSISPSILERLLLAVILGHGVLSLVVLGLALAHVLYAGAICLSLTMLLLLCRSDCMQLGKDLYASIRSTWKTLPQADLRLPAVVVGLMLPCLLASLMVALSDEIEYDAMMYHLAIPQRYVEEGGFASIRDCLFTHHCHGVEMLFTLGLATAGQPLPQLTHCLVGVLTAALLYCLARRMGGSAAGWLAALFFYLLPITTFESSHAMSDLFVTVYFLAAVFSAVLWLEQEDVVLAAFSGVFSGLAVGAKLNALLFLAPLGVAVLLRALWRSPRSLKPLWGVLACAAAGLLVWAPWLSLEYFRTGNPVFPFFNGIFKSPLWEWTNNTSSIDGIGTGHTWVCFLRLPWDLTAYSGRFDDAKWGTTEGLALLCLPMTILLWRGQLWRSVWLPAFVLIGGTSLWFAHIQGIRYLIPILPFMALFAAVNVVVFWSTFGAAVRAKSVIIAAALVMCLCWFEGTRWWASKQTYRPEGYSLRLAIGLETPQNHFQRVLPEYDPLRFLAAEAEKNEVCALAYPRHLRLYGGKCTFYHRAMAEDHGLQLGSEEISAWDEKAIVKGLAEKHVNYLLLTYDKGYEVDPEYPALFMEAPFLEKYCRLRMVREGWYQRRVCLYEFYPQGVKSEPAPRGVPMSCRNAEGAVVTVAP